jgi:subtilisin-like proprotein convertase family protein
MNASITTLVLVMISINAIAQELSSDFFTKKSQVFSEHMEIPTSKAAYFSLRTDSFSNKLKAVSARQVSTVVLPLPDGRFEEFEIVESVVMSPKLAAKFPSIKTYTGVSIENGYSTVRFDVSPRGFHAVLFTPQGTVYIDPVERQHSGEYQSYYKRDFLAGHKEAFQEKQLFGKGDPTANQVKLSQVQGYSSKPSGAVLRTYRLAVTATGEYTAFHGGTVEGALAAIVTTINRINGIFEREVSIRMVLVDNTDQLIYTDAVSDGYSNSNGDAFIDEVQLRIDQIIGDANYDIGHGVSTDGGGQADVGPCMAGYKARGITGATQPIGDPYDVDFVAHEIGHQLSALHTFNGTSGNCDKHVTASAAYEPGSGTTIMAYAGICAEQNIQVNADAYFHTMSFDQIVAYTTVYQGSTCGVVTATNNNAPLVDAGESGFAIPINTPFRLEGSATDLDGDELTYSWEQFDLGPSGAPNAPVDNAPLFRSFAPVGESYRTFPQISDLVNKVSTIGEILPSYSRDMTFRLTARDNKAGGGGVDYDQMSFEVTDASGPFKVDFPNTNVTIDALTTQMIIWNVANTNLEPVNCQKVNILLSTDRGLTFPTTLVSNTLNDGQAVVLIPSILTSQARIKVEAADNIFFDISDVDFSIDAPTGDGFSIFLDTDLLEICSQDNALYNIQVGEIGDFVDPVTLSVSGLPAGYHAVFDTNPVVPGSHVSLTISNTASESGTFRINVKGTAAGKDHTQEVGLVVLDGKPEEVSLQAPWDGAVGILLTPNLVWEVLDGDHTYQVQVSTDVDFINIVAEQQVVDVGHYLVPNMLNRSTQYFWRVKTLNICGESDFSQVNSFNTLESVCTEVDYVGSPVQISAIGTPTITSTVSMVVDGSINEVNVKDIRGLHTYVKDLVVTLISPIGTQVILFAEICGSQDDFDLSIDDGASEHVIKCPPTGQGIYQPEEPLATFNQEQSQGVWTLRIDDLVDQDGGQLDGWTLEVCTHQSPELKPATLVASVHSHSTIQLTWLDNALTEAGYRIYRSKAGGEFVELVNLSPDIESYLDTGLEGNTVYAYRLSAYNAGGDSEFALVETMTFEAPPLTPVNLRAENTITEITLNWKDVADNEDEFVIERSTGNADFVVLKILVSDLSTYIDNDVVYGDLYTYRVYARNAAGDSGFSNEVVSGLVTGFTNEELIAQVKIYPNPNQGIFQLSVISEQTGMHEIQVSNLVGKMLKKVWLEKSSTVMTYSFDLSDQPKGVYVISISNSAELITHRIMNY